MIDVLEQADEQYRFVKIRIRKIYESGADSIYDLLFNSSGMADFLNKAVYIAKMNDYDDKMLEKFKSLQDEAAKKKETLLSENAELQELYEEAEQEAGDLQDLADSTKNSLVSYAGAISEKEKEALEYEAKLLAGQQTISQLKSANNELQRDLDRRNREEEMRQDFLANVTHELKTPLALIRGYAEGLQDGIADDPDSRSYYLDTIVEEADKMNMLVQKVLMLNQLEFGDESVSMESFDIAGLIRNYLESASILVQQENARLLYQQEDAVFAWGDPFLIQEVFQNYFSNALHHVASPVSAAGSEDLREVFSGDSAAGEKVIDIRCEVIGDKVRVTVFNTGDNISDEDTDRIWEKFYKVDKARTREVGGSGVGLSIVKAVMETLNKPFGVINYDDGVGFWFELESASGNGDAGR